MHSSRYLLLAIIITLTGLLLWAQKDRSYYRPLYAYAEKLYNDKNPTNQKDSAALAAYKKIISLLGGSGINDSVLWDCYFKAAIFEQTYNHYEQAIPLLRECVNLQISQATIPRPSGFLPNLYLGNSYYVINRFDSARYYYKEAENIAMQYPTIDGIERLYNTFGILNFETGNYRQSKNNFEKAISISESKKSPDVNLVVNYKNNLASSLRKLYEFDAAMAIYKSLLPYQVNIDGINQNIASVYLSIGASPQAIYFLHQVKNNNLSKLNDLGRAHYNQQRYDSAALYFNYAFRQNEIENGKRKNIYAGLTYRYNGDLLAAQGNNEIALKQYQAAIQQMIFTFNDTSIFSNPSDYSGVFAVIELYETLLAKANAFQSLYQEKNKIDYLEAALQTFHSLYQLTDYVEKTYESDQARIFLNQKRHVSHHQPIEICIRLFQLTGKNIYLEKAFFFDERNKASVLSLGLSDAALKKAGNLPAPLVSEETNCKELINQLSLKASGTSDSSSQVSLLAQIREQELKLESINKQFDNYPAYHQLRFANNTIAVPDLQKDIIPGNCAILSFHVGDTNLLCWVISKNKFDYVTIPYSDSLVNHIMALNRELQSNDAFNTTSTRIHARILYRHLIQPLEEKIKSFDQLMIIPDDELSYIPFELLLDTSDQYLIKKFAISYNYSCSLLKKPIAQNEKRGYSILAYAPYSGELPPGSLPELPASKKEVEGLKGMLLTGNRATKEAFIQAAPGYNILHLATHAKANDKEPLQSYIAFYPAHPDSPATDRLFIPDIYSLSLPKTSLVILSACETGAGQLVKGEGLISLSRAFSYAGCANIITSQWKADDEATAFVARRLHRYLEKGIDIASSLQRAKLDYLDDAAIDGRLKSPAYWAHLRLTGQFETRTPRSYYWLLFLLLPMLLAYYIKKIRPNKSRISIS